MLTTSGILSLPGGSEWLIVLVVVLLIFGPKNLPKLGKAMGSFVTSFKAGQRGEELDGEDDEFNDSPQQTDSATKG